jgi:hypothetical protein
VIPDLGEELISLIVSRIECYSSCNVLKVEKLDAIECGVVGGIYSPNHQKWPLEGCCRMAHRTLSGAPTTSADRWVLTVGALTGGTSGLSGGAPDRSCRLSSAPSGAALTLARTVAH